MKDRLNVCSKWCPVEDKLFLANDALNLQPPLAFIETLGQGLVLKILYFLDEISVETLNASRIEHPEVPLILWL